MTRVDITVDEEVFSSDWHQGVNSLLAQAFLKIRLQTLNIHVYIGY